MSRSENPPYLFLLLFFLSVPFALSLPYYTAAASVPSLPLPSFSFLPLVLQAALFLRLGLFSPSLMDHAAAAAARCVGRGRRGCSGGGGRGRGRGGRHGSLGLGFVRLARTPLSPGLSHLLLYLCMHALQRCVVWLVRSLIDWRCPCLSVYTKHIHSIDPPCCVIGPSKQDGKKKRTSQSNNPPPIILPLSFLLSVKTSKAAPYPFPSQTANNIPTVST